MASKHQIRRVIESCLSTPWMILPEKLEEISEFLYLREQGVILSEEDIQARIGMQMGRDEEDDYQVISGVAVVPVEGVMSPRMNLMMRVSGGTSTQKLQSTIESVLQRQDVKAIVLDIDSPGGSAIGNEELTSFLASQRGSGKPVVASINGLGASAAYYVATGAEAIYASPSSLVGSIGTMMIHRDVTKASETAGVKYTVLQSSKFKADGNEYQSLSPQARDTLMERINGYHEQFVGAVAANRGVSIATVEQKFGQGKAILAEAALAAGMIDGVATLREVIAKYAGGAASNPSPPSAGRVISEERKMNTKIKAALFAQGLLDELDSGDAIATAALNGWFRSRGKDVPETDEEILQGLVGGQKAVDENPKPAGSQAVPDTPTLSKEDIDKATADERFRIAEINALATCCGGEIPQELIQQQIDSGATPEAASRAFLEHLKNVGQKQQVHLQAGEAAADKFQKVAMDAMLSRLGFLDGEPSRDASQLAHRPLVQIALEEMSVAGRRIPSFAPKEDIAAAWLAQGGDIQMNSASNDPAYHGAGSFPNLLSSLAGKLLDRGMEYAEATYSMWTGRMSDVADLKPHTIVSAGEWNLLPLLKDGRPFEHSDIAEGQSWIQAIRYGDEFVLTPTMVANDDLDAFSQALINKGMAHELTLNKLAVDLLISNPKTVDNVQLFDVSHANVASSGGAPSATTLSDMRKLHRGQVGLSGKQKLRFGPRYVLVSPHWETAAEQTLLEVIYPTGTTSANPFRGRYMPIVEPMLDDTADNLIWYTVVDPSRLRGLVHVFQSGYGARGQRRSYFRNETQCRHYQIEGRFGVAAVNHQAICKNPGQ